MEKIQVDANKRLLQLLKGSATKKKKTKAQPQTNRTTKSLVKPPSSSTSVLNSTAKNINLQSSLMHLSFIETDQNAESHQKNHSTTRRICCSVEKPSTARVIQNTSIVNTKAKKATNKKTEKVVALDQVPQLIVGQLENEIQELERQLKHVQGELDNYKNQAEEQMRGRKELEEKLYLSSAETKEAQKEQEAKYSRELENIKKQIHEEKERLAQCNSRLLAEKNQLRSQLQALEEQLVREKTEKNDIKKNNLSMVESVQTAKSEKKVLLNKISLLETEITELQETIARQAKSISSLKDSASQMELQIEENRKSTAEKIGSQSDRIREKEEKIRNIEQQYERQISQLAEENKHRIEELTLSFEKKLKETIDTFTHSIDIKDKEIANSRANFLSEIERYKTQAASLSLQLSEKDAKIASLDRKITQLQDRLAEEGQKVSTLSDELVKSKLDCEDSIRNFNRINKLLKDREEAANNLREESNSLIKIVGQYQKKVEQLEKENKEISTETGSVMEKMETFYSKIEQLEAHIRMETKMKESLQRRVDELEESKRILQKQTQLEIKGTSKEYNDVVTEKEKLKLQLKEATARLEYTSSALRNLERQYEQFKDAKSREEERLRKELNEVINKKEVAVESRQWSQSGEELRNLLKNLTEKQQFGLKMQEQLCKEQFRCDKLQSEIKNLKASMGAGLRQCGDLSTGSAFRNIENTENVRPRLY